MPVAACLGCARVIMEIGNRFIRMLLYWEVHLCNYQREEKRTVNFISLGGCMKKISVLLSMIAVFIGTVMVAMTLLTKRARSVSILGGADGPTSIFLAGKVDPTSVIIRIIVGVVFIIGGTVLFFLSRKRKSRSEK